MLNQTCTTYHQTTYPCLLYGTTISLAVGIILIAPLSRCDLFGCCNGASPTKIPGLLSGMCATAYRLWEVIKSACGYEKAAFIISRMVAHQGKRLHIFAAPHFLCCCLLYTVCCALHQLHVLDNRAVEVSTETIVA